MKNNLNPKKIISFIQENNLEVSHLIIGNKKRIEFGDWVALMVEYGQLETPYISGSTLKVVCRNSLVITFEF